MSAERRCSPPVLVGEVVFWLGSGSGVPKRARVRWIGSLAEIGPGWAVGLELDEELPCGGIDGSWSGRKLFSCQPKRGLIVPARSLLVRSSQFPGRGEAKGRRRAERYSRLKDEDGRRASDSLGRRGSCMTDCEDAHRRGMDWPRRRLAGDGGLASAHYQRDSIHSIRSSRSSGIFSLFKWFKREKSEDNSDFDLPSEPSSPTLPHRGLSGSVDTLFSTATANSFAFVHPLHYRPFGPADQPEIRIEDGPETATYRNRIRNRDRLRALDKNITLRKKYRLYGSETLPKSVDHINELEECFGVRETLTLGRKKRNAPRAPTEAQSSLEEDVYEKKKVTVREHRRTSSEPYKVCHVKGKRKAPPPPNSVEPDIVSISTSNSNSSKRSRKKRKAPSPPSNRANSSDSDILRIIRDATTSILSDGESQKEETLSNASTLDVGDVVCTDTLKLERGILKPNMEKTFSEPKVCPSSPVSPRPWYKRPTHKDSGSIRERDKRKERDRRKVEDWMLEGGFPRRSFFSQDIRHNILSKIDKSDDKRKSQVSILTNISELDREAAEIIKRGKEKEKSRAENHNAMYYDEKAEDTPEERAEVKERQENSRISSARDLISLFNAITNVTKVTVNSSLFPKEMNKETQKDFKKESTSKVINYKYEKNFKDEDNKHPIEIERFDEIVHRRFKEKGDSELVEDNKPGTSSASSSSGKIARVTIEELDDFDAERIPKSQVSHEVKQQNRNVVQSIPPIKEENTTKLNSTKTDKSSVKNTSHEVETDTKVVPVKQLNVWVCPRCTLENLRWRITCEACDMWRPNPFELREESKKMAVKEHNYNVINKNSNDHGSKTDNKIKNIYPNIPSPGGEPSRPQENINTQMNHSEKGATNNPTTSEKSQTTASTQEVKEQKIVPSEISKYNNVTNQEMFDALKNKLETEEETKSHQIKTDIKITNTDPPTLVKPEEINEDVRKARLAFFDKSSSSNEKNSNQNNEENEIFNNSLNGNRKAKYEKEIPKTPESDRPGENVMKFEEQEIIIQEQNADKLINKEEPGVAPKPRVKCVTEDEEKNKLKEMLKEMKHSLPKRPKPFKKLDTEKTIVEDKIEIVVSEPAPREELSQPKSQSNDSNASKKDYAEAYLIESETVIEEIKYAKKPSDKISSSVQTSGLVRQISPKIKPSIGKEKYIPITIEENTIKNGVLYTTVSNGVRKIGTGTFELLRPRDFANIKEIKTESKAVPLPVYANTVGDGSNPSLNLKETVEDSTKIINELSKQLVKPQGVANFRARLDKSNEKCLNTLAVNRLLKRLETAIASGDHELAATLARELAQLKVSCTVVRQQLQGRQPDEILLDLYVEDKVSHQGPFHVRVRPGMTVRDLKDLVEREYEIPVGVQRWILANQLASDDTATLESLGAVTNGFPVFLYLVAPDLNGVKIEEVEIDVRPSTHELKSQAKPEPAGAKEKDARPVVKEEEIAGPSRIVRNLEITPQERKAEAEINSTGTLALGWKCEVCTLMNSPTRPGCAACSAPRPNLYRVPDGYQPNQAEELRIKNEKENDKQSLKVVEAEEKEENYKKLVDLEKDDLIIYPEEFECPVCLMEYPKKEGIVLRECLHVFCRTCLAQTIEFSDEAEVRCPFRDDNYTCDSILLEREIKALVTPKAYEEHLAKSIALAETKIGNAFHCKTPDCVGWCIYEDNVNAFKCPVCTHTNCLTCQAVHEGLNCKQYQEHLNSYSDSNIEVKRTKEMLQEMVDRGEAMNCPTCQVVLMKKWGCDWLRCSMCKTEICWITRGPRWGPNGKGDTSGGCQCGVNGIKCHPKCTYCH